MQRIEHLMPNDVKVQAATAFQDASPSRYVSVYSTHSKNRGVALIINNITYTEGLKHRPGAENDGKTLGELFLQIGFQVESYMDLTLDEMKEVMIKLTTSQRLVGTDILFVAIMGHGSEDLHSSSILGTDNKKFNTWWVEELLRDANCEVLQDKPKIIMYQTCCGKMRLHEISRYIGRGIRNLIMVHSTMRVEPILCNTDVGTMYISLLCQTVMELAYMHHLQDLLQMTHDKFRRLYNIDLAMHSAVFNNVGFKNCYLHPKIYLEDGEIKKLSSVP